MTISASQPLYATTAPVAAGSALSSLHIRETKGQKRLVMLTAYDAPSAALVDQAGVDMILVGDSLGMVVLGRQDTLSVTMDEMVHHCRAVSGAVQHALVVGDMPFMSYESGPQDALIHAGRLMAQGGVRAVKLEGGQHVIAQVRALVAAGIPVMGHLGLTPQRFAVLGGFKVQGKSATAAQALCQEALALQEAGCFSLVLECVPQEVAAHITHSLAIPTIGIGAGAACDGQVLVFHDMLGINTGHTPRFVKRYADLAGSIVNAVGTYAREVREGTFPAAEHSFSMPDDQGVDFQALCAVQAPQVPRGQGVTMTLPHLSADCTKLTDFLRVLGAQSPVAVALSGGVDSRFLLHMCQRAGIEACAVHAMGPHIPASESAWARQWAKDRAIPLLILNFTPLTLEGVRNNSPDRCYYCKQHLVRAMRTALQSLPTAAPWCLCDGTNADDCHSHRPGLRALQEEGVRSPLAECGVDKAHIRHWAALTGLEQPAQAARPCLLTRLAYGMQPTTALLYSLAQAEAALAAAGLSDFRLRLTPAPILQSTPLTPELREKARSVLVEHDFAGAEILEEASIGGFFDRTLQS